MVKKLYKRFFLYKINTIFIPKLIITNNLKTKIMGTKKTFSDKQVKRLVTVINALNLNLPTSARIQNVAPSHTPTEMLEGMEELLWKIDHNKEQPDVEVKPNLLSEINRQFKAIRELDGTPFNQPNGYEPRLITLPNTLAPRLTAEILLEMGNTDLSIDDVSFKRFKGVPINYVNSPREMNNSGSGMTFPVQVTMKLKEIEREVVMMEDPNN